MELLVELLSKDYKRIFKVNFRNEIRTPQRASEMSNKKRIVFRSEALRRTMLGFKIKGIKKSIKITEDHTRSSLLLREKIVHPAL